MHKKETCSHLIDPTHADLHRYVEQVESIHFLRNTRVLFIVRVPSETSSLARKISRIYPDHIIVDTQHYFIIAAGKGTGLVIRPKPDLGGAVDQCRQKIIQAMNLGINTIILVQHHHIEDEVSSYIRLSRFYEYCVVVLADSKLETESSFEAQPQDIHSTCVCQRLEPMYWALFLNNEDSLWIGKLALNIAKQLIQIDLMRLRSLLHCTMCFVPEVDMTEQEESLYYSSIGRVFSIAIVGFLFSKLCWSARVKLIDTETHTLWLRPRKPNSLLNCESVVQHKKFHPTCGSVGLAAHLTVWTGNKVRNVQAKYELERLIELEHGHGAPGRLSTIEGIFEGAPDLSCDVIRIKDKEMYAVYFEKPLTFNSVFLPGY